MHRHFDRPKSVLGGHLAEMYGNWPMAGCYFVHWSLTRCLLAMHVPTLSSIIANAAH